MERTKGVKVKENVYLGEEIEHFPGVFIPKELWLDKELTAMEKLFFAEIRRFDDEDGEGCIKSNEDFAEYFDLTVDEVSRIIGKLKEQKYIIVHTYYKDEQVIGREIKSNMRYYINKH